MAKAPTKRPKRLSKEQVKLEKDKIKSKMLEQMIQAIGKQPDALPQLREIAQRVLIRIGGIDKIASIYAECLDSSAVGSNARLRLLETLLRMLIQCYDMDPPKDDMGLMNEDELIKRHEDYAKLVATKVLADDRIERGLGIDDGNGDGSGMETARDEAVGTSSTVNDNGDERGRTVGDADGEVSESIERTAP